MLGVSLWDLEFSGVGPFEGLSRVFLARQPGLSTNQGVHGSARPCPAIVVAAKY